MKNFKDFNFYKWFKDSKVLDENKNPLICYHGSRSDFSIFKPSKSIGNQGETDQIEGIYFTDSKEGAEFFALNDEERFLKQCYLSIQNPFICLNNNELKQKLNIETLAEANSKLKELGYDGLFMEHGFYAKGGPFKLYLAFYPEQIKSIKNDGSWNIEDKNIYS